MERNVVDSSAITSIGYEAATGTLEMEFRTGSIYRYDDVPEDIYRGLIAAPSKGQFFDLHVRDAGYQYTRVQ